MTAVESGKIRLLEWAAQRYAKRGCRVFPLQNRSKKPRWAGGFHTATTDKEVVERWWTQYPNANVGIATGKDSGLVVVDIDNDRGRGIAVSLGCLAEPTAAVITGRDDGGLHLYFRYPDFPVPKNDLDGVLEIKGDGAYVVAPPSVHPDTGKRYRWDRTEASILALPPKLSQRLAAQCGAQRTPLNIGDVLAGVEHPMRHATLMHWIARWAGLGMTVQEVTTVATAINTVHMSPQKPDHEVADMVKWVFAQEARSVAQATRIAPLPSYHTRSP